MYNHKDLTSIERLNYLLLALNGQALQFVQGFPFTAKNYSIALNFLVDRYENKKLTAATSVRQMLGLKSIINTFAASYLSTQGLNNSCLKSRQRRP